jgi:hypothetical protein
MGLMNELGDLAVPLGDGALECVVAQVLRVDGECAELMLGGALVPAQRAVSCLVALVPGDTVSVLRDGCRRHYVTAILEREPTAALQLSTARPLTLHTAQDLRLAAATSIEIEAGERVRLRAPLLEALVGRFAAIAKTVSVATGEALLHSRIASLCSELVTVAAERLGVSARHSHRQIDGTEQLRCRHLDLRASEVAHLRAGTTLIKSQDLVKIDASQIQIG